MKPLLVSAPASLELAESMRWYEERRPGWGGTLFDAVAHTFDLVESHPEIGSPRQSRPCASLSSEAFPTSWCTGCGHTTCTSSRVPMLAADQATGRTAADRLWLTHRRSAASGAHRRLESRRPRRAARWLQRLVRRRAWLYIESMNVAFELPPAQAEKLRQAAEQLGISPSELARAAVTDLLAERDDSFRQAAERVLRKNAELYRRLA